jgi:hypothetical protein
VADLDSLALDLATYARLSARLAKPFANLRAELAKAGVSVDAFEKARVVHRRELAGSKTSQEKFVAAFQSETRALNGEPEPARVEDAEIQETAMARLPTPEELVALPFVAGRYTPRPRDEEPEEFDPDGNTLPFLSDAIRAPLPFAKPDATKKDPR